MGYLKKYPNLGIKYFANYNNSPVYKIYQDHMIKAYINKNISMPEDIPKTLVFSDNSWQDICSKEI